MWLVRFLVTASLTYILGAIPTGLLVGRLYGGIDVRNYGSRSTGATNVLRTLGPGRLGVRRGSRLPERFLGGGCSSASSTLSSVGPTGWQHSLLP